MQARSVSRQRPAVQVIIDHKYAQGAASNPLVIQLMRHGGQVKVGKGVALRSVYKNARPGKLAGLSGASHAKALLTETVAVVGSCNFTVSSQANCEAGVLVSLSERGIARYAERFAKSWEAAEELDSFGYGAASSSSSHAAAAAC